MNQNNYCTHDPEIDRLIEVLAEKCATAECREMLRQIFTTAAKLGREHGDLGDFKLINTSLKELRHAVRIFVTYRTVRKAIIFGSARTEAKEPAYDLAKEVARALVEKKFMVISGAGGGIMAAANLGAGRENSFGINIKLPFEQKSNRYIEGDKKLMTFKYFFTRKLFFLKESDATVLLPGGFGTQDEAFENLTLFQTGKTLPRPIVLLEPEGSDYWERWLAFIDSVLIQSGYISPGDRNLIQVARSAGEAADIISNYYRVYHSLRYVKGKTVLRLNREVPPAFVEQLNRDFADLLTRGSIKITSALEEEVRNGEYVDLPRLVLKFNKRDYGRLNEMIQTINREAS